MHGVIWNWALLIFRFSVDMSSKLTSAKNSSKEDVKGAPEEEEEQDEVPVERLESWYIYAHVHDKMIPISCGDASQRMKWLAHVAIARWDEQQSQGWKRLGIPTAVHLFKKDGEEVDMNLMIKEVACNGDHVYIDTSLAPSDTRA